MPLVKLNTFVDDPMLHKQIINWTDILKDFALAKIPVFDPLKEHKFGSETSQKVISDIKEIIESDLQRKIKIHSEYTVADLIRVDFFIPEFNLIVEANGPVHYNGLGLLNQSTKSKMTLLRTLGYNVCDIDTIRFLFANRIPGDNARRYIAKGLNTTLMNSSFKA